MKKIFISYSQVDTEYVNFIKKELIDNNFQILNVYEHIDAGQSINEKIEKLIETSDIVLIVLSQNSMNSSFVMHEYNFALGYNQKLKNKTIIPIVIDNVQLPSSMSQIRYFKVDKLNLIESTSELISIISRSIANRSAEQELKTKQVAKIEKNLAEYIQKSVIDLRKKETTFRRIAYFLYSFSFLSLLLTAVFAFLNYKDFTPIVDGIAENITVIVLTLVVSTLLIALSKFSFTLGKSFMVESLRNSNRIHAISFGEFYLNVYGENIEWGEFKEAFQHWNIDIGSSFIGQKTEEYDPEMLEKLIELANIFKSK